MHVPRGFVIGLAVAFAAGLLASAAQASVAREYEDSPITVPVSRMGDELTYAQFEKGRPDPIGNTGSPSIYLSAPAIKSSPANKKVTPTPDKSQWSEPVYAGTRLGEAVRTTDRTGEVHDTVRTTSTKTGPPRPYATLVEHVDLDTRLTIRSDWAYQASTSTQQIENVFSDFRVLKPQLPGLEYQGLTLRLGDDVTSHYVLPSWINPALDDVQVDSTVERRAFVGDYDTYAIRTELHFRENARSGTPEALEAQLYGDEYRLLLVEYAYVSERVPYPVLVHRFVNWIHGQDLQTYEEMDLLITYHPGTAAVAWSTPTAPATYRASNADVERTMGSQTHPDGGRGERLLYSLEEAIRNVQEDRSLARFYLWTLSNTGYRLVGASLQPGTLAEHTTSARWTLTFATPEGKGFTVETERTSLAAAPVNREIAERTLPKFQVADLPAHPVTIAGADHLWSSLVSPEVAKNAPNRLAWGWAANPGTQSRHSELRQLRIGFSLAEQRDLALTMLTLDTETGNVLQFHEYRADFACDDCVILVGGTPDRPPHVVPNTVAAGVQPPTVTQAAVASTSFMAVFVALYFLPIANFVGTQALMLLPGFAKLRKDHILDNKLRDQVLTLIKTEPGIHASDIARRVDAGWGTVVYHLSVLERSKMISSLVDGRHKRFFPVGIVDFGRRGQLAVLRNTTTKTIFEMIAQDPGVIQGEIASRSQLSVPAAIWHLRRLEDAGLVGRAKDGRRVHYFANKEEDIPVPYDERDSVEIV